jgi:hypothetical protein
MSVELVTITVAVVLSALLEAALGALAAVRFREPRYSTRRASSSRTS